MYKRDKLQKNVGQSMIAYFTNEFSLYQKAIMDAF